MRQNKQRLEAATSLTKKDEYVKQKALKYATLKDTNTLKENSLLQTELKRNMMELDLASSQLSDTTDKIKTASASLVSTKGRSKQKGY
jgi:hypothetical protein